MKKKEELYSFSQQNNGAVVETDIRMIPLSELHDFNGHPFKVENDMALFELMQSIEKEGVIVPALARPKADGVLLVNVQKVIPEEQVQVCRDNKI